jgi:predicted negative regulator of RcsB-dependent stress response
VILFSDRLRLAKQVEGWQIKNGVAMNTVSVLAALQVMGWLQRPTRQSKTKNATNIYAKIFAPMPNEKS